MVCVPTNITMQQPSDIPNNLDRRIAQDSKYLNNFINSKSLLQSFVYMEHIFTKTRRVYRILQNKYYKTVINVKNSNGTINAHKLKFGPIQSDHLHWQLGFSEIIF